MPALVATQRLAALKKGGGVPFGALFINGVPLTIGGAYLVIGGNS